MSVIFVFIDGLGVGPPSEHNPLTDTFLSFFSGAGGGQGLHSNSPERDEPGFIYKKVDANLDVKGLPQSGTGQISLFTGVNASKIVGRHFGPYPHSRVKYLLEEQSLFHQVMDAGKTPYFLNAYPEIFFRNSKKRNRWSSTTYMARAADIRLNRIEDLINETALTAGITQEFWRADLGSDLPVITPEEAAARVIRQTERYDLLLFEYYLTDKAGHEQNMKMAQGYLNVIDSFLQALLMSKKESDTLVVCSDHGNIENLSIKTHTRNPVPLIVAGETESFREAESILDVTPGIVELLK